MKLEWTASRPCRAVMIAAAVAVLWPVRCEAIPAFARKYQTSCQTCHIAFPKLSPFGEAFRLRGYRMPAETEDMIKEPPVPLGAPAYKRVWPDAVWPSDIPGTIPFSLSTIASHVTQRTERVTTAKNDFRFPEEIGVMSGGTLGETLSFFGELAFVPRVEDGRTDVEIEIEHSQLNFNGPFGSGPRFNVKVGRFIPEASQPFTFGAVLTTAGPEALFMFRPVATRGGAEVGGEHGTGIALPHAVAGLEAYGIVAHRFMYSAGVANGIGPGQDSMDGNSAKDIFGRLAYKIGGLALDGEGYIPSDRSWQEKSLRVGFFAYRGDGAGILFPEKMEAMGEMESRLVEDRLFTRLGVDASLFFQDANILAGYVRGRDRLAEYTVERNTTALRELGAFTYHTWFAEGDYVLMPWLHGALRYEWLRPARDDAADFKRIVPNVTALVRANVKAYVEYQRDLGARDNYLLLSGLRFAF